MRSAAPFQRRALQMTSLIDVMFLLLLFFMLSTTFARTGELSLAVAGTASPGPDASAPVFVRLSALDLTVNGQQGPLEDLPGLIARLSPTAPRVLVSLGADVTAQRLADLLVVLRGIGGALVQVVG
ncbi:MAG: biopolymer transporter ExbD [Gemmobacter sp.]|nr:biopolymer transporter ExbD [Gemmobacter sp.]